MGKPFLFLFHVLIAYRRVSLSGSTTKSYSGFFTSAFSLPIGVYPFRDSCHREFTIEQLGFSLPIGVYPFRDRVNPPTPSGSMGSHCLSACYPFGIHKQVTDDLCQAKCSHCLSACPFRDLILLLLLTVASCSFPLPIGGVAISGSVADSNAETAVRQFSLPIGMYPFRDSFTGWRYPAAFLFSLPIGMYPSGSTARTPDGL